MVTQFSLFRISMGISSIMELCIEIRNSLNFRQYMKIESTRLLKGTFVFTVNDYTSKGNAEYLQ